MYFSILFTYWVMGGIVGASFYQVYIENGVNPARAHWIASLIQFIFIMFGLAVATSLSYFMPKYYIIGT